jgi:hypothetical protein
MALVRMMEMTVHQVIDMIPVWHRLVAATGAVNMLGIMPAATMALSTIRWIGRRDFNPMFLDLPRCGLVL